MQFQDRHLRPWFNGDYLAILTGQGRTVAAEPRKLHYRPMTRRVVISGAGPISALGVGIDDTWSAMREGRSGLKPLTCFDPGAFPCHVGGEVDPETFKVRNVVPKSYRKAVKVMCRDVELAVGAAVAAIHDAGLKTPGVDNEDGHVIDPDRMGCQIGSGLIAADVQELTDAFVTSLGDDEEVDLGKWGVTGMENLTPLWLLKYLPNMLACHVTIVHDCQGPSNTITCSESSSALSLGESMRVIERGAADACLTGGAESKLNPLSYYRQTCAGRLADSRGLEVNDVVRPFSTEANGTALGEGGGLLVLEAKENCDARGGRARADLLGYAATQSCDHDGMSATAEDIAAAIHNALRSADLDHESIDAIVPFGCGIPSVDAAEADAIEAVFGERAASIPQVLTVPYTGNCNAGNGAIQVSIACRCLETQSLPARLNTGTIDRNLQVGPAEARDAQLSNILVLSASQGGQNTAVILGKIS